MRNSSVTAFPDLRYTIEEEMAERDLVMTRFLAREPTWVLRRAPNRAADHIYTPQVGPNSVWQRELVAPANDWHRHQSYREWQGR